MTIPVWQFLISLQPGGRSSFEAQSNWNRMHEVKLASLGTLSITGSDRILNNYLVKFPRPSKHDALAICTLFRSIQLVWTVG